MSENDKNIPLIVFVSFTRNEVSRTQFTILSKEEFQGFVSEILRVVSLLGEKTIFFQLSLDNQSFQEFQIVCVY